MPDETQRILCAIDLSHNCEYLLKHAMNFAYQQQASLLMVHVIPTRSIRLAGTLAYFLNESASDVVRKKTLLAFQRMKKQLAGFLERESWQHPEYQDLVEHLLVYTGRIDEQLVEKANRFGCEAIVLGSRNARLFKRFFSGGTKEKILRQTKKPVYQVSMTNGNSKIADHNAITANLNNYNEIDQNPGYRR